MGLAGRLRRLLLGIAEWRRLVAVDGDPAWLGWLDIGSLCGCGAWRGGMGWSSSRTATVAALVAGLVVLVIVGQLPAATSSLQRPAPATSAATAATAAGIPVPDVVAQSLARAMTVMRAAGLRGVASDRAPSTADAVVVAQEPPAGLLVPANSVDLSRADDLQVWVETGLARGW